MKILEDDGLQDLEIALVAFYYRFRSEYGISNDIVVS